MKCFSEVSSSDVVLEVKVIGDRMKRTKTLKKKKKNKKKLISLRLNVVGNIQDDLTPLLNNNVLVLFSIF